MQFYTGSINQKQFITFASDWEQAHERIAARANGPIVNLRPTAIDSVLDTAGENLLDRLTSQELEELQSWCRLNPEADIALELDRLGMSPKQVLAGK